MKTPCIIRLNLYLLISFTLTLPVQTNKRLERIGSCLCTAHPKASCCLGVFVSFVPPNCQHCLYHLYTWDARKSPCIFFKIYITTFLSKIFFSIKIIVFQYVVQYSVPICKIQCFLKTVYAHILTHIPWVCWLLFLSIYAAVFQNVSRWGWIAGLQLNESTLNF